MTRSHAEARASYHRSSTALWPLLERENDEGLSESAGDDDDNEATEPAIEPISAGPVSAGRDQPSGTQNEPEDLADALAQTADESEGSVEAQPSGPERQNGVFSPPPTLENTPSEARAEGGGSEGESIHTSVEAPARVATLVPLSACRRADSLLTEEDEKAKNGSDQVVDSGECPVAGRPPGAGRHEGDSRPAQAVPEPPFWGVAALDPSHPTLL